MEQRVLTLQSKTDYLTDEEYRSINEDNRELIKILITITKKVEGRH